MLFVEIWAILMAELVGVVRRQVGYFNKRIDRCCCWRGRLN